MFYVNQLSNRIRNFFGAFLPFTLASFLVAFATLGLLMVGWLIVSVAINLATILPGDRAEGATPTAPAVVTQQLSDAEVQLALQLIVMDAEVKVQEILQNCLLNEVAPQHHCYVTSQESAEACLSKPGAVESLKKCAEPALEKLTDTVMEQIRQLGLDPETGERLPTL